MARLSPEKIAEYAHAAGFRGQDLTVAVAVALAESGGDPHAHNSVPPDNSYGLWQINMLGSLGPARREQFGLDANRELFDPAENARAAWSVSGHGDSFRPWSTYTNGAYKKYVDDARRAIRRMGSGQDTKTGKHTHEHGGHGGGGNGGFLVDPDVLDRYTRTARGIADDLGTLSRGGLKEVRDIAGDSFGKIGAETGFAAALGNFGTALQHQVSAVGTKADALAGAMTKTVREYRDQEHDTTSELLDLLRNR